MRSGVVWLALGGVLVTTAVLVKALGVGDAFLGGRADAAPAVPGNLEDSFRKARVDDKYRMLLRKIKGEKDAEMYQEFKDLGFRDMRAYAGYTDLPAGHWVYVAPYWYIWRDLTAVQRPKRDWGPEQATGEPDTEMAGDIVTALSGNFWRYSLTARSVCSKLGGFGLLSRCHCRGVRFFPPCGAYASPLG